MRRSFTVLALLAFLGAGGFAVIRNQDPDRSAERRAWKNDALEAIRKDLAAPDYLKRRFGEVPQAGSFFDTEEDGWLTPDTIVCRDGSWLAYRSRCHKEDAAVHDIFVAKASDGRWYYSDFHFCIDAIVLKMRGQPESLAAFKAGYHLAEFDGHSDDALAPTWKK